MVSTFLYIDVLKIYVLDIYIERERKRERDHFLSFNGAEHPKYGFSMEIVNRVCIGGHIQTLWASGELFAFGRISRIGKKNPKQSCVEDLRQLPDLGKIYVCSTYMD